jgi:two-component system, OmpR family, response regulator
VPGELKRILLVEDEPDIQVIARLALEAVGGFEVGVCSSGREALATVEGFAPDLVLLDVMMPGMDGPSTLREMRSINMSVPVVFITAKARAHEVARYKALGAIGVVAKPFDPMELASKVKNLWEEHRASP